MITKRKSALYYLDQIGYYWNTAFNALTSLTDKIGGHFLEAYIMKNETKWSNIKTSIYFIT